MTRISSRAGGHLRAATLLTSGLALALGLAPTTAEARLLPGWGSVEGSPHADDAWCFGSYRKAYTADFDGDGRSDLLCHSRSTGRKRIDFSEANTSGFRGTDWQRTDGWCTAAGEELHVGDFNGDGRADLLCRVGRGYADWGRKRIDFADANGRFYGTDFDTLDYEGAAQHWCTNAGEEVHVGDFNGDGKEDLLCYVQRGYANAGRKRVDFANSHGTFFGTNWSSTGSPSAAQSWCTNAGENLHVGDFNGDGKDDLLCHVRRGFANQGRRRVDLANSEGTFFGTNWSSTHDNRATNDWCTESGDAIAIGDLNADDRDDLVCVNESRNHGVRVDHAASGGQFHGTNGTPHREDWCPEGSEFFLGDYDGDGREDMACHNVFDGKRSIRYATEAGDYFSLCSDDSSVGDGNLGPIPIHFVVVSDPNEPAAPQRAIGLPQRYSVHNNPFTGSSVYQGWDPSLYFLMEVAVMNARTYDDQGQPVCVGGDCIEYAYESHAFYEDIEDTECTGVLNYATPPNALYAAQCDGDDCFPDECGGKRYKNWASAFACEIRHCEDALIRKPGALTVAIMDRCYWDGGLDCETPDLSFGYGYSEEGFTEWGLPDFFTAWDFKRMLRDAYPDGPNGDIGVSRGVEQHELGHVLGLGHTTDCVHGNDPNGDNTPSQHNNPMYKDVDDVCPDYVSTDRLRGYSYEIYDFDVATEIPNEPETGYVNQIEVMVSDARRHLKDIACQ